MHYLRCATEPIHEDAGLHSYIIARIGAIIGRPYQRNLDYQNVLEFQYCSTLSDLVFDSLRKPRPTRNLFLGKAFGEHLSAHWQLGIREAQSVQTSGWGMGSERYLCWLLQHNDVRDLALIPRLVDDNFLP
jgi:hypothetical protein